MTPSTTRPQTSDVDVDVLIVGAGVTGLGAASRLRAQRPGTSFLVVDAREDIGGTWDLFRYPGIRSDSDLITYGYEYKPWTAELAIAPGADIVAYLRELVGEYDLAPHLRLGRTVQHAEWSSMQARWTVTMRQNGTSTAETITARWLFSATGYYDHTAGHRPEFPGEGDYTGRIVHPQHWPADLDTTGKTIVVIGSGATAVTMVPALAQTAARVTMLQRSPGYVLALPARDVLFNALRRVMPKRRAFRIARRFNIARIGLITGLSARHPDLVRGLIRARTKAALPKDFDLDKHFKPAYQPWEERMCVSPDGDFFAAIRAGRADVVTDRIARFTADGVELESGQVLPADIVVTATGMNLLPFGRISASVDGVPVHWPDTTTYRSMMLSDLPNFVYGFGYTNNSWTLKIDLVTEHWCRLLAHMAAEGYDVVVPRLPEGTERVPMLDDLKSSYVQRGIAAFPRQGTSGAWTAPSDYALDVARLRKQPLVDDALEFSTAPVLAPTA